MLDMPEIVRLRLRQLALDETSLQAPNFATSDIVYHEPHHEPHEPATGVWSIDDSVYSFRLIGQVSAHHTFLGEYGDLFAFAKVGPIGLAAFMRAKWKVTLVLPATTDGTPEGAALRRQADALQQIEDYSCAASPLSIDNEAIGGTFKGSSFVYRDRDAIRASAYSDNIFQHALVLRNEEVSASAWPDPRNIYRDLTDDRKTTLAVRPLELFTTSGDPVDMAAASSAFSPGTWVELNCTLRMWDNSGVLSRRRGDRERRSSVRSFQIAFDSGQILGAGRLTERPRTTAPLHPAVKRPFSSLLAASVDPHPKKKSKPDADRGDQGTVPLHTES